MKKAIVFILYVIMVTIMFTGCNILGLKDDFDCRDTVSIAIGEKLYENPNLWVRLDSITEDSRCPEDVMCFAPGRVVAKFTVGGRDSSNTYIFSTDTLRTHWVIAPWVNDIPGGTYYNMTIISVTPERPNFDDPIPKSSYRINFVLEEGEMVYKPNIYLYPKFPSKLDVSLSFPQGGNVAVSDPEYPDEWQNIKVTPGGRIDGKHDYLFYEAALPDAWQTDEGWSVKQAGLKTFFENNMTAYGFNKSEISDFTEYWIPLLKDSPYYAIYPQHTAKIDEVVELSISKTPKSILRLFYVIKEIPEFENMPLPEIPEFERNGFTVTEWGVVLK